MHKRLYRTIPCHQPPGSLKPGNSRWGILRDPVSMPYISPIQFWNLKPHCIAHLLPLFRGYFCKTMVSFVQPQRIYNQHEKLQTFVSRCDANIDKQIGLSLPHICSLPRGAPTLATEFQRPRNTQFWGKKKSWLSWKECLLSI